jgi:hypothetical protein
LDTYAVGMLSPGCATVTSSETSGMTAPFVALAVNCTW